MKTCGKYFELLWKPRQGVVGKWIRCGNFLHNGKQTIFKIIFGTTITIKI